LHSAHPFHCTYMLCMLFVLIFIVFMYYFTCISFAIRPSGRKSAIKLIDWLTDQQTSPLTSDLLSTRYSPSRLSVNALGVHNMRWGHADIGSESRFLHNRPAPDAPVRGVPVGILPCRFGLEIRNGVATRWCKKIWRYVYSLRQNPRTRTWETDGRTHRRTPHDGIGRACIASRGKTEFLCVVCNCVRRAVIGA